MPIDRAAMGVIKGAHVSPPLDVYETEHEVIVEADLPGADPAGLRVAASDRQLSIEGSCRARQVQGRYLQMERCHEEFGRPVVLPAAVDPHRATARYERGVLIVTLPKIRDRRNTAITIPVIAPVAGDNPRRNG
jgi:HSP20 family protein